MKKIFFAFSFMLLSFLWTVQAQKEVTVRFGGLVGFNMSQWGGDFADYYETTFRPGFHIGGLAEMMLNQQWSIQPELLFSYEGTNSDVLDKGISAMYVKLPVLVYYNFLLGSSGRLSPGAGVYCAGGLAGKIDGDQNTFDGMEKFDWGVEARLAYEVLNQKGNGIFAALGFSQGFSETHSMMLKVSVGYKFPYSKWLNTTYYKNRASNNNYND